MALGILKHPRTRLAFQVGRTSGLKATNEIVDQLQAQNDELRAQLEAERQHHEQEMAALTHELMRLKYELAKRDVVDTFRNVQSPSELKH